MIPTLDRLQAIASAKYSTLSEELRVLRAKYFVESALATWKKTKPTSEICLAWSNFADFALQKAFRQALQQVPLQSEVALFAYGKLGAQELNLSSDVDLVLISEKEEPKANEWLRVFRGLLQDITHLGFCFRLDFDLRPGGRMGPLVPTVDQFEDYFSNYGEAWERLAFVRFRPICGDSELQKKCQLVAQIFTYRKHLDFTLLEDLKVLRQRIQEQNWRRSENGALDIKLGLGGIRDLELFVHTQQVIHGGRDPSLRTSSTQIALEKLTEREVLLASDSNFLIKHYWDLRHFENLLQAATDQQIQVLPADQWLDLISKTDRDGLRHNMQKCQELVTGLLGPVDVTVQSLPDSEADQRTWLLSLGYSPEVLEKIWFGLMQKNVLSRQPERDELYRRRFLFEMTQRLAQQSHNPNLSLEILSDFLKSIRAKATFFHLLLQRSELLDRLVLLFSSSSYLSRILIQRPELLDSFLYQLHDSQNQNDWDQLLPFCLEKKLLTEMTAGLDFLRDQNLEQLLARVSEVADAISLTLLAKLQKEYQSSLEIIAMGKWGGQELGIHSDLDLVFVTNEAPTEEDFRVARRFISRITEVQKGGSLYELDFRLKPHGKGGLLLTTKNELIQYLKTEASAWQRQAYLKARPLKNSDLSEQIQKACVCRPLLESDWRELSMIHAGLLEKAQGPGDLKYSAGGLIETEFIVQLLRLAQNLPPHSTSTLLEFADLEKINANWKIIHKNYQQLRRYEQSLRLVSSRPHVLIQENSEDLDTLASLESISGAELMRRIVALLAQNAALLAPLDPRPR